MINTLLKRRMENTKKNKKGFTLVELIVVLVIIAILAAVLVPTVSGYIGKAKKTAAQSSLKNVITAANSAGQSLIESNASIAPSNSAEFVTNIKEVGGTDILKGVVDITLDSATGTVIYAKYSDGTYASAYYYDSTSKSYKYQTGKTASVTQAAVEPTGVTKVQVVSGSGGTSEAATVAG